MVKNIGKLLNKLIYNYKKINIFKLYMNNNLKTCNKTSNNKYFDSPARMDDGRAFTDYRSSNSVDDMIRFSNNIGSSYEYRQFLINNATNIMNINNKYTVDKVGSNSCNSNPVPFYNQCNINTSVSNCSVIDDNGIGLYNNGIFNDPIMKNKY
jgi:hypothetical protein